MINGVLVRYVGLSSLVVTLGMNFFWAGFTQVMTNGYGAPLVALQNTALHNLFVGQLGLIPVQMFWAALFPVIGMLLFTRHNHWALEAHCLHGKVRAAGVFCEYPIEIYQRYRYKRVALLCG